MLCSLLQLERRLIKNELGERHSQSTGNNHEYAIIQQWKSAKFTKNESFNVSDNQPRRAEASRQRPARKNGNRTNATKRRQPYDEDTFRCYRRWREQKESQPFG